MKIKDVSVQEPGINGHMSLAGSKDNGLSVLHSIDFCLPELSFLNRDVYLVALAVLHYQLFGMICFTICFPFSKALTPAVKYFSAWLEWNVPVRVMAHELPRGGLPVLGPC